MPRRTKAQIAADEAAAAEFLHEAEALAAASKHSSGNSELDDLMARAAEAGEEAVDDLDAEIDLSELDQAEEQEEWAPFAAKRVPVEITEITLKKGENSGDAYLNLRLDVFEGPYDKRVLFDIVMLQGKGVGMGKKKLRQLGVDTSQTFRRTQLINTRHFITTKIKKATDEYDAKTVVRSYDGPASAAAEAAEALPE